MKIKAKLIAVLALFGFITTTTTSPMTSVGKPEYDKHVAHAQPLLGKGLNTGESSMEAAMKVNKVDDLDFYMVDHGRLALTRSDTGAKEFTKGNIVTLTKDGGIPDTRSKLVSEDDSQMVKVPSHLRKGVKLIIKGSYQGNPLKIYSGPNDKLQLNATFTRPDYIYTDDLKVYNGKFLKVKDDNGHTWYVNTDEADWAAYSEKKLKIIGDSHKEIVSNEKNISTSITTRTNLSAEDIHKITKNTHLEGIESAVVATEEKYGVNSLFILSVAAIESGWGQSNFALYRNNLFGICAFDSNVNAATSFASKTECIDYFGRLISKEYFAEGYTDPYSINKKYASNTEWGSSVQSMMHTMIGML